jgi:hypothetical protein
VKKTQLSRAWLLLCASLVWCGAGRGQTTGEIRGNVKDPSEAVIPDAHVTAMLAGTDTVRTATTGKDGDFEIAELPVGTYSISAEAQGFKKFLAKDVIVSIGHVAVLSVTLEVGGSNQTVTVEADTPQVETTSTQLGAVMTGAAVRELPLSTRNTYQLLQLQPGVQSQLGADLFLGSGNAGVVSVNGGRGRSNNYMVNGGDGNDQFVNSPAIQPSPDSVEQFRVLTNTFDAEYGRNSGSIVNVVTKSGTNDVHGDFYEFNRNQLFNTRGYFDPRLSDYKQNQFGATLGGPVKKDRTFAFGSYEGNRLIQGSSSGTLCLPTTEEVNGDFSETITTNHPCNTTPAAGFSGTLADQAFANVLASRPGCASAISNEGGPDLRNPVPAGGYAYSAVFPGNIIPKQCFDPTAVALYNRYVAPTGTGKTYSIPNNHEREDQFTIRFDQKVTNTQQFSAYYYFNDDDTTGAFSNFQSSGANIPGFGSIFKTRNQQWNLSHTWTIGTASVNEFRFNYFREGQGSLNHPVNTLQSVHDACGPTMTATCFTDPTNPYAGITTNIPGRVGVPLIAVNGGFSIGNNYNGEIPQTGNTFQWTDNFTKTFSKHTLKFGADVRRQRFNLFAYYNINGWFTIADNIPAGDMVLSDIGYPAYPNYFLGASSTYGQGAAQREDLRNTALYLFLQDSYKLRSNLTLNYGLRWELNVPYHDLGNRLQTFRAGQATTQYPCLLNVNNPSNPSALAIYQAAGNSADCSPTGPANSVFPLGLVFPGDKGVARGLTATYYKAFAPRVGLAWSPDSTDGWLAKLTGGRGKSSIRLGFGIFYNPIEALVMEQFSGEPPFGGSASWSATLLNLPFESQAGGPAFPNVFQGIINQTPQKPCSYNSSGPKGCVDWSAFRPMLLFGEFRPNMKSQYSEQYNLTIERQLTKDMILRVGYVGTSAHHLLASYDLNHGHAETCLGLNNILGAGSCGPGSSDSAFFIPPSAVIPSYRSAPGTPRTSCSGLALPYNAGRGGTCIPPTLPGQTVGNTYPNGITLVGLRQYSSPLCQPLTGAGCPVDGVPVFSSIYAEDTIANSNYNGLQLSVEKNYSHGLLFQVSYTFSKAIDQAASFENELDPLNFNFTRGLSLLDAKHRFVFSPVWDIPAPEYEGLKGKAFDGWGASAIITYQSGFPIRVQNPADDELQGSTSFFEGANTPQATGAVQFVDPKASPNNQYFLTGNLTDPPPGTFGNMPHAFCCGSPISNTDLVITKKTGINERWRTEFRAEFYNTWNHTQFNNPDGNFGNSTFGQILKVREGPRVMQFALKFLF